jgi:hypothetical protein
MILPSLKEIDRELAKKSLSQYIRQAWHVVEPARAYIHGWHIDAIAYHLEAATRGEIQNLIISMPPRHMKSLLICVLWPTWVWTFKPDSRWLFASYGANLAIRDSLKCRRIIQSPWYQENFGDVFQLAGDQNQRTRFENDKSGYRLATGVGGGGTGEGGEFIVADDSLKAQDAKSDAKRDEANEWWDNTMSTRGNDPDTAVRVVVQQRLHENDLPGHLQAKMSEDDGTPYELLCLPAEYEPNRCILSTGWIDPRRQEGELLWPQRFSRKTIDRLKRELDDPAGQLQQRPTSAEGGIFQKAWWDITTGRNRYSLSNVAIRDKVIGRWLFYDTAFKDKAHNDPSACCVWELWPDYRLSVRAMWNERIQSALLPGRIQDDAIRWNVDGKLRAVVVEDKGSGTTSIQTLRMAAPSWLAEMITEFQPNGTKEYRARLASVWCERDCIMLPWPADDNGDWYSTFLDPERGQLWMFPNAAHDDLVDVFTSGIIFLEHFIAEGFSARMAEG